MFTGSVWRFLCCAVLLSSFAIVSHAQNAAAKPEPVLDVHVHAMDVNFPGVQPMCPNTPGFLASDPKDKESPWGWVTVGCTPSLAPAAPGEYLKDVIAEMERLNVTAVVFGDPKSVQKWKDAAPASASSPAHLSPAESRPDSAFRSMSCARISPPADSK